ncbi:MAG: hypothetical protein NXY57DRAFT_664799 [Lentinula lateritia]|nr:MAG: hypothetical protein NXY57DRAFT_664799 [Lentinula lateritia]
MNGNIVLPFCSVLNPLPPPSAANSVVPSHQKNSRKASTVHPYAHSSAKNKEYKRRRQWHHVFDRSLFNALEFSNTSARLRRTIYLASLEAHVDGLHAQLSSLGYPLVSPEPMEAHKDLHGKTAKKLIVRLQYNTSRTTLRLLELQRANEQLERLLSSPSSSHSSNNNERPSLNSSPDCAH